MQQAEQLATMQGVSLDQFILWAVAKKVGEFKHQMDDPVFPLITYRCGAGSGPVPVLRRTGIRVQVIVVAAQDWHKRPAEIAAEYDITESQVNEALTFYKLHAQEIDTALAAEQRLEKAHG
jgi:uncharacterized protein (DUF433 family)